MNKALRNKMIIPPGGWKYRQPESGVLITGGSWKDLLENIRVHRISNNYPIGLLFEEEISNALCEALPEGAIPAYCEERSDEPPPRVLGLGDLKNFLRVVHKWTSGGFGFVSQEEAERRAEICSTCLFNVKVKGCRGCRGIVTLMSEVVGQRRTSKDSQISGCKVCGCALQAAVHLPLEAQAAGVTPEMWEEFPDHCWKKYPPSE